MIRPRASGRIGAWLDNLPEAQWQSITELRLRVGKPAELVAGERRSDADFAPSQADMDELIASLSGYARYAVEGEMARGYIPVAGGHRAGVCGKLILENGRPARMSGVTSICLRMTRMIPQASAPFRRHLLDAAGNVRRVLIFGPPGCGKTTVLRDASLWLSDECGRHVAVCDERGELFSQPLGKDEGKRIDVLRCERRENALMTLLRSMSPDVLVADEIGTEEDARAIAEMARCGVGLLATAHGGSFAELIKRPTLRALLQDGAFDRIVWLRPLGRVAAVYDSGGMEVKDDELGCGGAGADGRSGRGRGDCGGRDEAGALGAGDAPMPSADE